MDVTVTVETATRHLGSDGRSERTHPPFRTCIPSSCVVVQVNSTGENLSFSLDIPVLCVAVTWPCVESRLGYMYVQRSSGAEVTDAVRVFELDVANTHAATVSSSDPFNLIHVTAIRRTNRYRYRHSHLRRGLFLHTAIMEPPLQGGQMPGAPNAAALAAPLVPAHTPTPASDELPGAVANKLLGRLLGKSPSMQVRKQLDNATSAADAFLGKVGKRVDRTKPTNTAELLGEDAAALLERDAARRAAPLCGNSTYFNEEGEKKAVVKHSPAATFPTSRRDPTYINAGSGVDDIGVDVEQEQRAHGKHSSSAHFATTTRDTGANFLVGSSSDISYYGSVPSSFGHIKGGTWRKAGAHVSRLKAVEAKAAAKAARVEAEAVVKQANAAAARVQAIQRGRMARRKLGDGGADGGAEKSASGESGGGSCGSGQQGGCDDLRSRSQSGAPLNSCASEGTADAARTDRKAHDERGASGFTRITGAMPEPAASRGLSASQASTANEVLDRLLGRNTGPRSRSASGQAAVQLTNVLSGAEAFLGKVGKRLDPDAEIDMPKLVSA